MVAAPSIYARAQSAGSATIQTLRERFPDVRILEVNRRVKAVYGVRMTTGATAAGAAHAWAQEFARAFTNHEPTLELYSRVRSKSGKTVVTYRQSIDGMLVEGAACTVVLADLPTPVVTYAAGRMADRPVGGLAPFAVSANLALAIAQTHPAGAPQTQWAAPRKTAIYRDRQDGTAPARAVWVCVGGGGPDPFAAYTFYIDGATGEVVEYVNAVVAARDVSGVVKGYRTPGLEPDTFSGSSPGWFGTLNCPNTPTLQDPLPDVRVTAHNSSTQILLAETQTNDVGTYTLPLASGLEVDVEAALISPFWEIRKGCSGPNVFPPFSHSGLPADTEKRTRQSSTLPVNFSDNGAFNHESSPPAIPPPPEVQEFRTADVNAHRHMALTHKYFTDRIFTDQYIPGLHDKVDVCTNGNFIRNATARPAEHRLLFARSVLGESTGPNTAHSMWVAHEYGHYLLHWMRGVEVNVLQHSAFHEGYADTVAHLLYDSEVWGVRTGGCLIGPPPTDHHGRVPLCPTHPIPPCVPPQYPYCEVTDNHSHGMLLSAIWIDVLREVREFYCLSAPPPGCQDTGLAQVRQTHVDWCLLTDGGVNVTCPPPNPPAPFGRAAHVQTLIEVLTADDNDGNLGTSTPHRNEICAAFLAHGIWDDIACGGSRPAGSPQSCAADCDGDGIVSSRDFVCFNSRWSARDLRADCTADGAINVEDWSCFQRLASSGCP